MFYDPKIESVLSGNPKSQEYEYLMKFFKHLALCHTAVIDEKTGNFSASSPDELAILNGLKDMNVLFESIDENQIITLKLPNF